MSSVHQVARGQVVGVERPGGPLGGDVQHADLRRGKPSITARSPNLARCFTHAPARTVDRAPIRLKSHTIAPGSTTVPDPRWQPWIIAPGPITTSSSITRSLSG